MKVLVTGAAGFIGNFVAEHLCARGDEVVGIDNINDYYDTSLKHDRLIRLDGIQNFKFLKIDLNDDCSLQEMFDIEKFDAVVHLAAQAGVRYSLENPKAYIESNIVGFGNILELCRNFYIKHLVYASSSSVYGANKKIPFSTSDSVDQPVSLYAASKKSNELMAYTYSHLFRVPTTGLRFFTVYGPWGRPDMAPFLFTNAILKNEPIKVYNNGKMQRDFTFVDDIVDGVIKVLDEVPTTGPCSGDTTDSHPPYKIYNIGNSSPIELEHFIACLENSIGKKAIKDYLPMQPGDVVRTYADVSDLERDIGYKPSTELAIGVQKFVAWFKDYYNV